MLIGPYAIKIPNFRYCHRHFLQGCYANWSERQSTRATRNDPGMFSKIAPTLFCTWFGLLSIQRRAEPLDRNLTLMEIGQFTPWTTDLKKENFGYLNGKIVCIDYV